MKGFEWSSLFEAILVRCDPRCVRFEKTEKRDNQVCMFTFRFIPTPGTLLLLQVFLSYDCETATVPDEEGSEVAAEGDTYLLRLQELSFYQQAGLAQIQSLASV